MLRTLIILLWELRRLRAREPAAVAPRVIERLREETAVGDDGTRE